MGVGGVFGEVFGVGAICGVGMFVVVVVMLDVVVVVVVVVISGVAVTLVWRGSALVGIVGVAGVKGTVGVIGGVSVVVVVVVVLVVVVAVSAVPGGGVVVVFALPLVCWGWGGETVPSGASTSLGFRFRPLLGRERSGWVAVISGGVGVR